MNRFQAANTTTENKRNSPSVRFPSISPSLLPFAIPHHTFPASDSPAFIIGPTDQAAAASSMFFFSFLPPIYPIFSLPLGSGCLSPCPSHSSPIDSCRSLCPKF